MHFDFVGSYTRVGNAYKERSGWVCPACGLLAMDRVNQPEG
ncbi:MAG: hypothetical protein RDU24_11555 [Humidesulfovibrio sp.]|nr:hypothetical protein [Humidesulfovibrio sp.]